MKKDLDLNFNFRNILFHATLWVRLIFFNIKKNLGIANMFYSKIKNNMQKLIWYDLIDLKNPKTNNLN